MRVLFHFYILSPTLIFAKPIRLNTAGAALADKNCCLGKQRAQITVKLGFKGVQCCRANLLLFIDHYFNAHTDSPLTDCIHRPTVFMATNFRHQLVGQFRHPLDSQPLFFIATFTSRYKLDKKINALELQRLQKIVLHFPSYHSSDTQQLYVYPLFIYTVYP